MARCCGGSRCGRQSATTMSTVPASTRSRRPAPTSTSSRCRRAGRRAGERESYYSFDVANVHVVVLNSAHPPYLSSPEKGNPMLAWLERDLAATSQEWIIAYWHHPPYGKALYDSDVNNGLRHARENLLPALEAGGVDFVLSGHNHYYARSYFLHRAYGLAATNPPQYPRSRRRPARRQRGLPPARWGTGHGLPRGGHWQHCATAGADRPSPGDVHGAKRPGLGDHRRGRAAPRRL